MQFDTLSPDQLQKAFKLCDILSLQDLTLATTILQSYGWNVQKAVDQIAYSKQQENKKLQVKPKVFNPPADNKKQQNQNKPVNKQNHSYYVDFSDHEDQDPYMMNDQNIQDDMVDYEDYEYEYAQNDLQKKKKMFEQNYISEIPLIKTVSQPHHMMKQLQRDKLLAHDYHLHRHYYQTNLLKQSQQLCQRILQSSKNKNQSKDSYQANNRKIMTNKRFIVYLHKVYKSKVNFTFGTFMLNLIRSYLDEKFLLVFILHQNSHNQASKVVEKMLTQPEIANFANNNCISYGMFDNSDDYQIVQKYIPMKDLPAFAIFKYSKKNQKQQFVSSYPLLGKQDQNFLEWMAKWMRIALKKKDIMKKSEQKIITQQLVEYEKLSDILRDQNVEYQEMEKLYKVKRNQSRLNKQKLKQKQNQIVEMRKKFDSEPQPEFIPGKSMQIKFRMPISGQSKLRVFNSDQKVQTMFNYIETYFQDEFQEPFCEFDLTQTFPTLSLRDKKDRNLKQIFQESDRQNLIVKEI